MQKDTVVILDFGSQYNQLIARRVRECNVYSILVPCNTPVSEIRAIRPKAIILSGGPASVHERNSPKCSKEIFEMGVPILGICYGMQLLGYLLGGRVGPAKRREYGHTELIIDKKDRFFEGCDKKEKVWMSHGDQVLKLPKGFKQLAHTRNTKIAVMFDPERRFYGVQFHPEVAHTLKGMRIFKNFLYKISGLKADWTMQSFINEAVRDIRSVVKNEKVVLGLSGGVDSSVTSVLLHRAVGKNLHCIFVDNGLLRKNEKEDVVKTFREHFHINLHVAQRERQFLEKLKGVTDPEEKRRIIGREFIKVFEEEAAKTGNIKFLAQGTLYPDVIDAS